MTATMMKPTQLMRVDDLPIGSSGAWTIERFTVSEEDAKLERLRAAIGGHGRGVPAGDYTALKRHGSTIMSDTRDELHDHLGAFFAARRAVGGRVLIAGLGLGCLLRGILVGTDVAHVDVVDLSSDVIALVGDHYQAMATEHGKTLAIHEASILDITWPTGTRWDVAWFDIWDNITEDNRPDMTRLARSYGRRADWKGYWSKPEIDAQRDRYRGYRGW